MLRSESINGSELEKTWTVNDALASGVAPNGALAPGDSRDFFDRVNEVRTHDAVGEQGPSVAPVSVEVVPILAVFEDNTAYGEEQRLQEVEFNRAETLKRFNQVVLMLDDVRKSSDPRAFVAQALAATPKPEPGPLGPHRPPPRDEQLRRAAQSQMHDTLVGMKAWLDQPPNGMTTAQVIGSIAQWPTAAKGRIEGHVELTRVR